MSNKIWYFSDAGAGPFDGFNNSAMDHFRSDNSIYREVLQNSLDNAVENSGNPVYVKFEKKTFSLDTFGLNEEFSSILDKASEWTENADKEDIELFYNNAKKILKDKSIEVFCVSDYNTKGLYKHPHDVESNFFRLILNPGASKNSGDGGGSHGHGQHAAYARSDLRTVFFQTFVEKNIEETDYKRLFVGKTILNSWESDNSRKRGSGYFITGLENGMIWPFFGQSIPDEIKSFRSQNGTDIFILAPILSQFWYRGATASVVDNFFAAIEEEKLQVEIVKKNDTTIIDKENIDKVVKGTQNLTAKNYLDALRQTDNKLIFKENIKDFGEIVLKVAFHERGNQKVALLRKPRMKLKEYNKPILPNFSAVLLVNDNDGNRILRNLEDSEHKDFEKSRELKMYPGKNYLEQIEKFIDEKLFSLNQSRVDEKISLSLGNILPSQDDGSNEGGGESDSDEINTAIAPAQMEIKFDGKVTQFRPTVSNLAVMGGSGSRGAGGGYRVKVKTKGGGGTGGTSGGSDSGDGVSIINSINSRIFINNKDSNSSYVCRITCIEDCEGYFGVSAIGIDAVNIKPKVKKAFYLNDENKKLSVLESSKIVMGKLKKGEKISLIIETDLEMPATLIAS